MLTIDAIRRARNLEWEKEDLAQRRAALEAKNPPAPPKEPIDSPFTPKEHPPIKVKTDWKLALGPVGIAFVLLFPSIYLGSFFNFVFLVLGPLATVWAIAYLAFFNKKRMEAQRAKIEASPEYRSQCAQIDLENAQNEAQAYQDYCNAKRRYDEELLPQYEQEKAAWEARHASDLAAMDEKLSAMDAELETLYADDAAVDIDLRNAADLEGICRIADAPGSSESVEAAIAAYRRKRAAMHTMQQQHRAAMAEQHRQQEAYEQQLREERYAQERAERKAQIADTVSRAREERRQRQAQNEPAIALLEARMADLRRQYHNADPIQGAHIQSQIRSIEHQIAKLRR